MRRLPQASGRWAGIGLSLVFTLCPARAEAPRPGDAGEDLPDMDVTVGRMRQPKDDLAVPVTVITPTDVQRSLGGTVADALRIVPGFDSRPAGSDSAANGFSLRGAKAEQVLVLIDGRRVGTAQGGGMDLNDIPLYDVQRIEILRGGASALYGSDPIGGVINIITRRGGNGRLNVTARYGSFGAFGLDAGAGDTGRRGGWRLNAQHYVQEGDFSYKDDQGRTQIRTNNGLMRKDLRLSGDYDLGGWGRLEGGVGAYRAKKGVPGDLQFPSPAARQIDERYDGWLRHHLAVTPGVALASSFDWQAGSRDYEDKTGFFPVDSHHNNRLLSGELLATFEVAARHQAVVGIDWRRDEIASTNDGRRHRVTSGFFGQYELGLGAFTLIPSARVDFQTAQKAIFTPRIGLTWAATTGLTLRAGANRSFRAPSFDDLFWPEDAFSKGNPNLTSERALEWNLGANYRPWRGAAVDLDYFNRDAAQLITWLPGQGGKYAPTNLGRVRFQGLEAAFETPVTWLGGVTFRSSYAYLKATTHSGSAAEIGKQIIGRPMHQGTAGLRYTGRSVLADLNLTAVGSRYTTAANTQSLPSYATVDATVRWQPSRRDTLSLELRNMLDSSYRAVLGYPLPGLEVRFAASRDF